MVLGFLHLLHRRAMPAFFLLLVLVSWPPAGHGQSSDRAEVLPRFGEIRAEARAEASRRELIDFVSDSYWDTPAGRRHMARMRREEFAKAMTRFVDLGTEAWETRFDQRRQTWVLADEGQAEDLSDAVDRITEHIEREYDVEGVEIDPPSLEGTLPERVESVQAMVRDVLPGIADIVGGDLLDAMRFIEVRESLARIKVLADRLSD